MYAWKLALSSLFALMLGGATSLIAAEPLVRTHRSGDWSNAETWDGGKVPAAGARVQIRQGHHVRYDVESDQVIRSIHVAGILEFARDRNTRLDVGLIKIQPGDDASENGFDCEAHMPVVAPGAPRPALLVGLPDQPVPAGTTALIRLTYIEGMDKETCPAIVCCGGRMEFHGAPLKRTWVKLPREAYRGEPTILLKGSEIEGWKPGDHLVLSGTTRQFGYKQTRTVSVAENPSSEERLIKQIRPYVEGGLVLVRLDKPLDFEHRSEEHYRGDVANLTRNVIVESANPDGERGHTMYHKRSQGSISYAEFRHLGKEGVLGKYSLHFHLLGDTMRGTSVVGASIWDSKNRWITVHGTSDLVVRDCVGYKSVGHGFFLEDGTETRNIFDRNLAIMALRGKPLPDQVLPFDQNLGSGFWWSNSLNSFTNNVAAECDQDGFRFEVMADESFDPVLAVLQPDGTKKPVDIRTLPFIRFENNEAHCQRFFGLNLGGFNDGGVPGYGGGETNAKSKVKDVERVGPDARHPFLIKNFIAWNTHWAFHGGSPSVRADGLDFFDSQYGIWRTVTDRHEYSNVNLRRIISMGVFNPRPGLAKAGDNSTLLRPVDDLPPSTVITHVVAAESSDHVLVKGVACDDYEIKQVLVNGRAVKATEPNFAQWEIELPGSLEAGLKLEAKAEDLAGNVEQRPHLLQLPGARTAAPRAASTTAEPHKTNRGS